MFSCQRFVRYEGVMTTIGINVASLMMLCRCVVSLVHSQIFFLLFDRIKALYGNNLWIVGVVAVVLMVEFGVNVSLLVNATCTCIDLFSVVQN
jgi:hypothetical protein